MYYTTDVVFDIDLIMNECMNECMNTVYNLLLVKPGIFL